MSGKLFIVSAPSGAGKTSLVEEVLGRLKPKYLIDRLITYTSRDIRKGEKEGVDFCFVSSQEFEMRIKNDFFLEWSKEYHHYYGSPASVLQELKAGNSRVLVIDQNGAKQVLQRVPEASTIWIYTPTIEVLRERLEKRGLNTPEQIKKRLEIAKNELAQEEKTRSYKHHILNGVYKEAADNLENVLLGELLRNPS